MPWALIPTAGRGRRLHPATVVVPKVLLPVGTMPMLHWTLLEALDAGVGAIVVVVSPDQPAVGDYLEAARRAARGGGADDPLRRLGAALEGIELHLVEQPRPRGIGEALMRCRAFTGSDPFAVLLPDNWFEADVAPALQVAGTFEATGLNAIGLVEVTAAEAALLGNVGGVDLEPMGGDSFRIVGLQDKGEGEFRLDADGPVLRGVARYVLHAEFYEALAATGPPADGEWDDVPAFQALVEGRRLAGHRLEARHFDVGHPAGYLAAAAYLACP